MTMSFYLGSFGTMKTSTNSYIISTCEPEVGFEVFVLPGSLAKAME